MTTPDDVKNDDAQSEESQARDESRSRTRNAVIEGIEDVDRAAREALDVSKVVAANVGESIRETIKSVRSNRDSVVMVRVNKESLRRLDQLVDCGLTNSRSEAAALLITEGIKARTDLYDKIAEQSEVIRNAREELKRLLDEDSADAPEAVAS
jgi:hypothetical protein